MACFRKSSFCNLDKTDIVGKVAYLVTVCNK